MRYVRDIPAAHSAYDADTGTFTLNADTLGLQMQTPGFRWQLQCGGLEGLTYRVYFRVAGGSVLKSILGDKLHNLSSVVVLPPANIAEIVVQLSAPTAVSPSVRVLRRKVHARENTAYASPGPSAPALPATDYATWTSTRRVLSTIIAPLSTFVFGNASNYIDGAFAASGADSAIIGAGLSAWQTGDYIQLDTAESVVCDGMRVYVLGVGGESPWDPGYSQRATLLGSDDVTFATFDTLASGVEICDGGNVSTGDYLSQADTWDPATGCYIREYAWTPVSAYRYYRLLYESGAGHGYWYTAEFEFRVSA